MKNVFILFCLYAGVGFAQVGIGTTNPNASLDIRSSNEVTPANTDGLLIPKVEEFPAINPTVLQDSMLVFATGAGSVAKGYYSWDNASTSWVLFTISCSAGGWYSDSSNALKGIKLILLGIPCNSLASLRASTIESFIPFKRTYSNVMRRVAFNG